MGLNFKEIIKSLYVMHTNEKEAPPAKDFVNYFNENYLQEFNQTENNIGKKEIILISIKDFVGNKYKFIE